MRIPHDKRLYVRCDSNLFTSYSNQWDVLSLVGEEEDTHIETIASFITYDEASKYAQATEQYVIGVRPPSQVRDGAHKWVLFMTNALTHSDSPVERFRRY